MQAILRARKQRIQILSIVTRSAATAVFIALFAVSTTTAGAQELNSPATGAHVTQDANYGSIAFVRGEVTLIQPFAAVSPPAKGTQVNSGDLIITGADGFVSLVFKVGESAVNVQPDSRVVIGAIDCLSTTGKCEIALNVENGEIYSEANPSLAKELPVLFSVRSPFSSAVVRGPVFDFGAFMLTDPDVVKETGLPDNQ